MIARSRSRADTRPLTWEPPAAACAGFVLLALMILPAAQAAAAWIYTGTFSWPRGSGALSRSIGGLLTGRPGRGLPASATRLPPVAWVYSLVVVAELSLGSSGAWALVLWWRHVGPGTALGMASRREAEAALGQSNLTKRRALIRPDLEPTNLDPEQDPA